MIQRFEFCAWCGRRRPIGKLLPLAISSPDMEIARQYHCRVKLPCLIRAARRKLKRKKVLFFAGQDIS